MVTDPYFSETAKMANIYIPVATFAEKNGTFTNFEGRVQTVRAAVTKQVPSDFEVVKSLIKLLGGKSPETVEETQSMIKMKLEAMLMWTLAVEL